MKPTFISKPQLSPSHTMNAPPQMRSVSPLSFGSSSSTRGSRPAHIVAGGCGGPKNNVGPSGCQSPCAVSTQTTPPRPPRPDAAEASQAQVYEAQPAQISPPRSSPPRPTLRRLSTATTATLQRHLSIASSASVLPFSNRRRPSIPIEDFPSSPTDDEWEDFSLEDHLTPVSPRRSVRRKPSVPLSPLSPRLVKGASLSRSHASRRSRRSRMNLRGSTSPVPKINSDRPLSVYSTYSYYDPSQIDDSAKPMSASSIDSFTEFFQDVDEFGEVPAGSNLQPRGSVSSIATVRPEPDQRKESRLGGLKDKLRWLPGRSGHGQESSSDESGHGRTGSDASVSSSAEPTASASTTRPGYFRANTTSRAVKQRPIAFTRPGFRSMSKSSTSSNDFQPRHGHRSSTDSSSYAPSFSSFEQNFRIGGQSESYSSCGDDWVEESPKAQPRPLSPSRASSIIMPSECAHIRSRSDNYEHLLSDSADSAGPLPTIRMKNGVPHHSASPEHVPYPLAYSANMMAADRWNHALLFGDDRNPANAGGLLRGSTVSFSQFYGVGSGKKEVLKGRELRGGKVLDLGCGEGLWVLAAAKEWRHTRFVGFDMMPVQMNLQERLEGVRNAQDIIDRIEWVQGDFLQKKLPFESNSFDLVRLANTTLALPTETEGNNCRLRNLFSEIFRILKVDGELEVIDENHVVPSSSKPSPSHPENKAYNPNLGPQMQQLEQAFGNMLKYHKLSAYDAIPKLLEQNFSTSTEKAKFKLAIAPDETVVANIQRRTGISEEIAVRAEIDHELGLTKEPAARPTHGRLPSSTGSATRGRNHKMLQLLGQEFAESRKPVVPQGLIVLPNKMLPLSPAAVYAHATHSTNVLLAAKEQLFSYVELCAQGRAVADRQEFEDLVWEYEASRFDRIGLRDPMHSYKDWDSGISDSNEGLYSFEQRSPKLACSPPPDAARVGSMGPLPTWRYESEQDVVTVREIRVCLARKLGQEPPAHA